MTARARLHAVREIAPRVLELEVHMVDPPEVHYRAGQFISLLVPAEDGPVKRPFSIVSSPSRTDAVELLAKLVPGGRASEWLRSLAPGAEMSFVGPAGQFLTLDRHPGAVVFAVTGAGIAAALPLIRETLSRPTEVEAGPVRLYWGLRHERDIYWLDRLEELAARSPRFTHCVCLSAPGPNWSGVEGRIIGRVLDAAATLEQPTFYAVGNGDMVRELRAALIERGVDRRRSLRTEIFYPTSEL